jgi:hypothetical protein
MNNFSAITKVVVSLSVVERGQGVLRLAGNAGLEGMVLWAGTATDATFHATELLVPKQRGIKTKDGVCVVVDGDELHRLNVHLHETGLRLIAQVHSHPGRAYHSNTDDQFAVATTIGNFSLVVPDFAVRPFSLRECAIYRLTSKGAWNEVDESLFPNQIVVNPSQ